MRKTYLFALLLLVSGCQWNALAPGDRCWYRMTTPAFRTDTVWNQVPKAALPDSVQNQWRPFVLFQQQTGWADSVRVCGS